MERLPDDAWTLNNMAVLSIELTKPPEPQKALDFARRAYQASGRNGEADPLIADTYGWALSRAGKADEAIRVLEPTIRRLSNADTNCHLAEAYLAARKVNLAWPPIATALSSIHRDQLQGHPIDANLRKEVDEITLQAVGQTLMRAQWFFRN